MESHGSLSPLEIAGLPERGQRGFFYLEGKTVARDNQTITVIAVIGFLVFYINHRPRPQRLMEELTRISLGAVSGRL
jgi:hypothetical protein